MNQENTYSKGCEVKYLLKRTSVDLVEVNRQNDFPAQSQKQFMIQPRERVFSLSFKDLGHFWLGYIRMLGHLQLGAHRPNFERL